MSKSIRKAALALALLSLGLLALAAGCEKSDPQPTQPTQPATQPAATVPATTAPPTTTAPPPQTTGPSRPEPGLSGIEEVYTAPQSDAVLMRVSLAVPSETGLEAADAYYQDWLNDATYYIGLDRAYLEENTTGAQPYDYEAGFSVCRNDDAVLSISRFYYTYTGGAHGGTTYFGDTFVTQSGAMLTLGDLFAVPRETYLPRIEAAVLAQIETQGRADALFVNYADMLMEYYESRDFYLTEVGVVFFWQEYTIAPGLSGMQAFEIPYGDLADILSPQWMP